MARFIEIRRRCRSREAARKSFDLWQKHHRFCGGSLGKRVFTVYLWSTVRSVAPKTLEDFGAPVRWILRPVAATALPEINTALSDWGADFRVGYERRRFWLRRVPRKRMAK